ncbi:MAG: hypothetical protein IM509_01680, partial [Microcystis sp. M31BS1]
DTSTEETNETASGTNTQSSETNSSSSSSSEVQGSGGTDSVSDQSDSAKEQGKEKQGQNPPDPELKPGDIRLQDGTIVRAGAERRHFEQARLFRTENIALKNDLNTANQRFNTLQEKYQTLESTIKQIGMENPQAVTQAVRLYNDLQTNPVQAVTNLLAELKAMGHSFDGIGGTVDTLAIQHMLNTRGQPPQDEPTPEQQFQAIQEEAARETTEFLRSFPDAKIHERMIANVIAAETESGREVDLRSVYFKLRQAAINNGFDWSQPLEPQIEARRNSIPSAPQQPSQNSRPIIQGRGGVGASNSVDHFDSFKSGSNETKDSVILAAMRDAGYNYTR